MSVTSGVTSQVTGLITLSPERPTSCPQEHVTFVLEVMLLFRSGKPKVALSGGLSARGQV